MIRLDQTTGSSRDSSTGKLRNTITSFITTLPFACMNPYFGFVKLASERGKYEKTRDFIIVIVAQLIKRSQASRRRQIDE